MEENEKLAEEVQVTPEAVEETQTAATEAAPEVKEEVAGKRFGDIQNELTKLDGVSDVEVKFPYFWVRTVPNNVDKITIEFNVENASE